MFNGKVYPGAGAIIIKDDNPLMVLVLRRGRLRWELPAGIAEPGESMEQTAIREVKEETGLTIVVSNVIANCWHYSNELMAGWMGLFFWGQYVENEEYIPPNKRIPNVDFQAIHKFSESQIGAEDESEYS